MELIPERYFLVAVRGKQFDLVTVAKTEIEQFPTGPPIPYWWETDEEEDDDGSGDDECGVDIEL